MADLPASSSSPSSSEEPGRGKSTGSSQLCLLLPGTAGGCAFGAAERKCEAESVFAVQVEPVEMFVRHEAEGGI